MDTRLTTTHFIWRSLIAASVALALVIEPGAATSAASPNACRVQNAETGKAHKALQASVDAASKGDRLTVKGTCVGRTVIGTSLVITGLRTEASGKPTLSGVGKVRVLIVEQGARVKLRDVVIMRGYASAWSSGSNIVNRGSLTLRDVLVDRNGYVSGGFPTAGSVVNTGTLRLNGASRIRDSWGDPGPGGVDNRGTLVLNGSSSIDRNHGVYMGGVSNDGVLIMNGSSAISRSMAESDGGVMNYGTLVMNDTSTISGNYGADYGGAGGLSNSKTGSVVLNDAASISGNEAGEDGPGGVLNDGGTVEMNGSSSIDGNASASCAGAWTGGKHGTFKMNDSSSISGNEASSDGSGEGGGVCVRSGTLTMTGASTVTANRAAARHESPDGDWDVGGGGGIYQAGGHLVGVTCGPGGNVQGNTPNDCYVE